jgi:hypothetical protein
MADIKMARDLPPASELFQIRELAARHPQFLNVSRVRWAVRWRDSNGLAGAVYEARAGGFLVHEPAFLQWFLGLRGRNKPRSTSRR